MIDVHSFKANEGNLDDEREFFGIRRNARFFEANLKASEHH